MFGRLNIHNCVFYTSEGMGDYLHVVGKGLNNADCGMHHLASKFWVETSGKCDIGTTTKLRSFRK